MEIGRSTPDIRVGVTGVMLNEFVDVSDRFADDSGNLRDGWPLSDEAEPAADLVEPREIGRSVVDLETRSLGQPGAHFGMSAGDLVICDQCISRC
jgi:hypothetical protein